jgi:hypothetical protein
MDNTSALSQTLLDDAVDILHDVTEPTPVPVAEAQAPANPLQNESLTNDLVRQKLHHIRDEIDALLRLLGSVQLPPHSTTTTREVPTHPTALIYNQSDRIVEGTFTGQKMLGSDNEEYHVPPNYASKSKLVPGDHMKLTITQSGAFIYKQISPVPRKRLVGELTLDSTTGQWSVVSDGKPYKILTASATFYRGKPGDEVVFLVPESGEASWGAVENIIHK